MGGEDSGGIVFTGVYASLDGESHFEDVTVRTTRVVLGPGLPGGAKGSPEPVSELTFLRMDEGYVNDWHPAPRRQFVLVSAGEVEVTVSTGEVRRFGPGSVFLADDTAGRGHQTKAVGAGGCVVVWVACQ